jgi:hypothetical protein
MKRIESLSDPGAEEAGLSHASHTPFGATTPAADFASDDQRTNTAFGQIVVGGHTGIGHEHKEFGQEALNSLAERVHRGLGLSKRGADLPQLGMVRMQLFELVDLAQEMDPAALMQALMDVVRSIKIAAQHPLKLLTNQAFDHLPRPRVMILVVAHHWRADAPNVAIFAIFSPPRFIGLHGRAGSDLGQELIQHRLSMRSDAVKQFHHLSHADLEAMECVQELTDLSNGQTQAGAQIGDHAGKPYANASLPKDFLMQIDGRFLPFLARCTIWPTFGEG